MNNGKFDFRRKIAFAAALVFVSHCTCTMPAAAAQTSGQEISSDQNENGSDSEEADTEENEQDNGASEDDSDFTEFTLFFDNVRYTDLKQNYADAYGLLLGNLFEIGHIQDFHSNEEKNELIYAVDKNFIPRAKDYEFPKYGVLFKYKYVENNVMHYDVYYRYRYEYIGDYSVVPKDVYSFAVKNEEDYIAYRNDNEDRVYNYFKAGAELDIVPGELYACAEDTDRYTAKADNSGLLKRVDDGEDFILFFGGSEYRFTPKTFTLDLVSSDYFLSDSRRASSSSRNLYEIKWKDIDLLSIESNEDSKKAAFEVKCGDDKAIVNARDGKVFLSDLLASEKFKNKKGISLVVSGIDEYVTAAVKHDGSEDTAEEAKLPVKKSGEGYTFEAPYLTADGRYLKDYYYAGAGTELNGEAFTASGSRRCREIAYKNDMKGITLNYVKLRKSSGENLFSYKQSSGTAKRNDNCYTFESLADTSELVSFGEKSVNKRVITVSGGNSGLKLNSYVLDKSGLKLSMSGKEMEKSGFVLVRNLIEEKDGEYTDSLENGICFYLDKTAPVIDDISPSPSNSIKNWKDGKGLDVSFSVSDTEDYPYNDDELSYYDAAELHNIYDNFINAESADKQEIASVIVGDYRFDRPSGGWSSAKAMSGYIENDNIRSAETDLITLLRSVPIEKLGSYNDYDLNTYSGYRQLLLKKADSLANDIDAYCEKQISEEKKKLSSGSDKSKDEAVNNAVKKLDSNRKKYKQAFAEYSSARKNAKSANESVPVLSFDTESRRFVLNFKPAKGRENAVINEAFEVFAVDNSNNISTEGRKIYVDIDGQAPQISGMDTGNAVKAKGSSNVYVLKQGVEISVDVTDGNGSGVREAKIYLGEGSEPRTMQKGSKDGEYVYTVSESDLSGKNVKIPIIVEAVDNMGNKSALNSSAELRLFVIDETKPVCGINNISGSSSAYTEVLPDGSRRTWFREYSDIRLSVSAEETDTDICSGIGAVSIIINGRTTELPVSGAEHGLNAEKLAAGEYCIVFVADENADTFSAELKCGEDTVQLGSGYALEGDGSIKVGVAANDISSNNSDTAEMTVCIDKAVPKVTALLIDDNNIIDTDGVFGYGYFSGHSVGIDVIVDEGGNSSGIKAIEAVFIGENGSETSVEILNNGNIHNRSYRLAVPDNFKGRVRVTVISNADRRSDEVISDGIITENYSLHSSTSGAYIELPDTPYRDADGRPLYRSDVNARVTVKDSFSGVGRVTVNASGRAAESRDIMSDSSGWSISENGTDHNLLTEVSRDFTVSQNSNGNYISVGFADNAGNSISEADRKEFSIDTAAPRVGISFGDGDKAADKANGNIFKTARKAVIEVTERNFDESRMEVTVNGVKEKLQWKLTGGTEGTDSAVYSAVRDFESDGDYKLVVKCSDMCGWDSNVCSEEFIIDTTAPVLSNVFDNSITNDHYYSKAVTASFTVSERNFDPALIELTGTFNDSTAGFPSFSEWTSNGSEHTASVKFDRDGEYTVRISGTDKAGNKMEVYTGKFCVDSRKPTIAADSSVKSSNAKEIRPRIMFEDTNINKDSIKIRVNGANRGSDLDLGGQLNEVEGGYEYVFDNIPDKEENDDIYKVRASAKDNADNKIEKDFRFSVNRYGSVFEIDSDTRGIRGRFVSSPQDIVIIERNPDSHAGPQNVYITKDSEMIELKEGEDYSVEHRGGDDEWSEYTYRVFAKNFENDARYSVSIHTRDEAGNINISNSEKKNADVAFCIDKTMPLCIPLDITENTAYKNESVTAHLAVSDNIMLKTVKVYIDGKQIRSSFYEDECAFVIPNAKHAQNVRVVLTDMAENEIEYNYRNILVTTSAFRIIVNKLWFRISCGAAALLAAAAAMFIRKRKKRLL